MTHPRKKPDKRFAFADETTFGEWLRTLRSQRKMTLVDLERQCGISNGHLSRIENNQTQTTLVSGVAILNGLAVRLDETLNRLYQGMTPTHQNPPPPPPGAVLTSSDVQAFVRLFHPTPDRGLDVLTRLLNMHLERSDARTIHGEPLRFTQAEIIRWFAAPSLVSCQFVYPPTIKTDTIVRLWQTDNVIVQADVDRSIAGLSQQGAEPREVLKRLSQGDPETVRFTDVLRLEQSHRYRGFMLSLYWKAACFAQDVVPDRDDEQALRLAVTLVHLARWFQDCAWEDVAWLHWLRGQFDRDT